MVDNRINSKWFRLSFCVFLARKGRYVYRTVLATFGELCLILCICFNASRSFDKAALRINRIQVSCDPCLRLECRENGRILAPGTDPEKCSEGCTKASRGLGRKLSCPQPTKREKEGVNVYRPTMLTIYF